MHENLRDDAVTVPDDLITSPRYLPLNVRRAQSMMSREERTFLYLLAKRRYTGAGYIVDAGVFLGASTLCFGQALIDKPKKTIPDRPIIVYDLARVSPGMMAFFRRKNIHPDLKLNDDLRSVILENTRNVGHLVDYRFGNILDLPWKEGRGIEVFFIDILKTEEVNRYVFNSYFRYLIPGRRM